MEKSRLLIMFVLTAAYISGTISMTTRKTLICPEGCVCLNNSGTLHCGNNFKSVSTDFSTVTRNFKLQRNFVAPLLNGTFSNLISARVMDLSNSNINYVYAGAFKGLGNLKEMNLRGNAIQFLDEYLFEDSLQLERLDISRNKLTVLPSDTFRFLLNLKMLNISYNRLTSVKFGVRLQVTTILQVIDFSGNNIERISANDFEPAEKWDTSVGKILNFSSCNIQIIEPEALISFGNIEHLGLGNNVYLELDNITAYLEAITSVSVKSLDLSYTDLSYKLNSSELTVDNLGPLSIRSLYLAGNGFTQTDDHALSYLNLNNLDLSHNQLSTIGSWTASMNNLVMLDMSHNAILTVDQSFKECLPNMKTLKLSHNVLADHEKLYLQHAGNLEYLDLSYNKFLSFRIPVQLSKLRYIDLSNNLIQDINNGEVLAGLDNLVEFHAGGNKLTSISAYMFRSSNDIEVADFHHNLINHVSDLAFVPNCPKVLDLSQNELVSIHHYGWRGVVDANFASNRIREIHSQAFLYQNKLKRLNLNGNQISYLDQEMFTHLTNLTILELKGNNLTDMENLPILLAPLQNLESIDLSYNNFSDFNFVPLPFSNNYELKHVRISNNKFKTISPKVFSFLPKLERLDFSRNPFDCGCENLGLQKWMKTSSVNIEGQDNFGYICREPRMRGDQTLMEYTTKMFECDRFLYYIMIVSATGGSAMLVSVVVAVVCYFVKRQRSQKLNVSDAQTVDLLSHEKLEKNGMANGKAKTNTYLAELRAKYMQNNRSDTLVGVEFENPHYMNGHVANLEDMDNETKKKSKNSTTKKGDKKVEKKKRTKHDKKKSDHKGVHFANGGCKHSEQVKKMLEYVDKEMKKDVKKRDKPVDDEPRERRRRSRGNRDLVRMVSSRGSLRGSKSMPDVVRYINSLPRYTDRYRNRYARIPIYHVDHIDERQPGWARSMVDIPRRPDHRARPSSSSHNNRRLYEEYVKRRRREREHDDLPQGYHTIVGGRGRAYVDTRMMENSIDELDGGVQARPGSPKVKHTVATIHGTDIVDVNESEQDTQPKKLSKSNSEACQLSQWL